MSIFIRSIELWDLGTKVMNAMWVSESNLLTFTTLKILIICIGSGGNKGRIIPKPSNQIVDNILWEETNSTETYWEGKLIRIYFIKLIILGVDRISRIMINGATNFLSNYHARIITHNYYCFCECDHDHLVNFTRLMNNHSTSCNSNTHYCKR